MEQTVDEGLEWINKSWRICDTLCRFVQRKGNCFYANHIEEVAKNTEGMKWLNRYDI